MSALQILSILVGTAALFGWISSRWLRLPVTIGTMLLTVLASLALTAAAGFAPSLHTGAVSLVHQVDFQGVILRGMLPLLLFAGAFLLDLEHLAREKLPVALLSIVGTVFSVFSVAALMALLAGTGSTWIECLLFGALISPTDPIAVLEMLRRVGVPSPVQAQLAGESLFNDGIGAVIFLTLLGLADGRPFTFGSILEPLVFEAGGAVLLGVVLARVASEFIRSVGAYQVEILLTLALALGGYTLAGIWHLSAPLEAVVAGIALRHFNSCQPCGSISHERIDAFWKVVDEVQNSILFVLLGLEFMVIPLNGIAFRAGAVAILAVNLSRLAIVALLLGVVRMARGDHRSSVSVLTWGGLRGGLSIALALSVPAALGYSWVLGATYLVVVFSIVLQGGSLDLLLRRQRPKNLTA